MLFLRGMLFDEGNLARQLWWELPLTDNSLKEIRKRAL